MAEISVADIMDKIRVVKGDSVSYYEYWDVELEESPNQFIVVDKYSLEYVLDNFNLDEDPSDEEIEDAITNDFEDRLEKAYAKGGIPEVRKLLKRFEYVRKSGNLT